MPYNKKHIQDFIKKVNAEAEEAAQAVYAKYTAEFERKVLAQMRPGDRLVIGMGTATFSGEETDAQYAFAHVVAQIQYTKQNAGFLTEELRK